MTRSIKRIIKEVKRMANNQASVINAKTEQMKELMNLVTTDKEVASLCGILIQGFGIIFIGVSIACCYVGRELKKG